MMKQWIPVVAGALRAPDGRWLMHRRPAEKHHGGLWEFPGGKVEDAEIPVESLVRELREELGITIVTEACIPVAFAEEAASGGRIPIVILLYRIANWVGDPTALEGGAIGWFTPREMAGLDKPPLDIALAERLFADQ
ncbi:(deoxy)nucleoside triphosphate pyrophosphohydrolase [Erythrobacter sp. THAF29]|uniref:(deoxy)nucleoside triphosphate pyrophosphohydrolase n=1 Tax=Erythrobacter sp. THAF29 TaxID=2587851 RepID=UPI001267CF46|nr:(deoxy)nucleoside triphosphate pyrophosphohydrolase [Erythrobacter sp. THAF29]QFT77660.1 CTP pyrophosphohydrolase [Erythrobacter sp. THAF29]